MRNLPAGRFHVWETGSCRLARDEKIHRDPPGCPDGAFSRMKRREIPGREPRQKMRERLRDRGGPIRESFAGFIRQDGSGPADRVALLGANVSESRLPGKPRLPGRTGVWNGCRRKCPVPAAFSFRAPKGGGGEEPSYLKRGGNPPAPLSKEATQPGPCFKKF